MKKNSHRNFIVVICVVLAVAVVGLVAGCGGSHQSPQESVEQGWEHFRTGNFDSATIAFERAISAVDQVQRPAALYALGMTCGLRRPSPETDRATRLFEQVIREYPHSEWAGWSQLALARQVELQIAAHPVDRAAVSQAYQVVIDRFPGHPAADEALVYQQANLIATLDQDDARAAATTLHAFLQRSSASPLASMAHTLLAECFATLNDPQAQLREKVNALNCVDLLRSSEEDASTAYWTIATQAQYEVGDAALARAYYRKFIEAYSADARCFAAEQALVELDRIAKGESISGPADAIGGGQ